MRRRTRIPFIPMAIAALAATLAGCYTMLKHPDISNAYEFDGEQDVVIASRCGDCHAPPMYYRRIPYLLPDEEGERAEMPLRPIDPGTPTRVIGGGVGPIVPSSTPVTGGSAAETRVRDDGTASTTDTAAEPVKKVAPAGKTPVRRTSDETSKDSTDSNKKTDKKREQP